MIEDGKCNSHCETCTQMQRSYCAVQIALNNQAEIVRLKNDMAEIKEIITKKEDTAISPISSMSHTSEQSESGE